MTALQPSMFPDIEGPDFIKSPAVASVGADVLRIHGAGGAVGQLYPVACAITDEEIHVLWLLNVKPFNPETDEEGHDAAGKCVKAPGLWHDVTGYDVAIWIREYFWDQWDEPTRRAAILHELLHVEVTRDKDDQAKVKIRKHEVEDFVAVALAYGPIFGEAPRYIRAASVFAGEPTPLHRKPGRRVDPETGEILVSADVQRVAADAARRMDRKLKASGTSATITAAGRTVHIGAPAPEVASPAPDEDDDLLPGEPLPACMVDGPPVPCVRDDVTCVTHDATWPEVAKACWAVSPPPRKRAAS